MVRIELDTDRCVGAGQCVLSAPDNFDQDDDGIVVTLDPPKDDAARENIRTASSVCPSGAITVHED